MRRKDRLIPEADAFSLLEKCEYGIISTVSADNNAYGFPVNYALLNKAIYFHCATEGKKIDNITANPRVSFCVVGQTEILQQEFSTKYESCIVDGYASEVFATEKKSALEALVRKYSPDFIPEGVLYIEKLKDKTRVFKITIDKISGKAKR